MEKRRGRPRSYDPDTVLDRALRAFWQSGYAATSLDDLSAATGLNRPSLYAAFGDKQAIYLAALDRYRATARRSFSAVLGDDRPIGHALRDLYARALDLYLAGDPAFGCFLLGTAAAQAVDDPLIRAALADSLAELDRGLSARFEAARRRGELAADADPEALARMAGAVLHSLAVRARAGESRAALERLAAAGVETICPAAR